MLHTELQSKKSNQALNSSTEQTKSKLLGVNQYTKLLEVGQIVVGKLGLAMIDVDSYIKLFCTEVRNMRISVPLWIIELIEEHAEWLDERTAKCDGHFDDFLWQIFCHLFGVKAKIFMVINNQTQTLIYGSELMPFFELAFADGKYLLLSYPSLSGNMVKVADAPFTESPSNTTDHEINGQAIFCNCGAGGNITDLLELSISRIDELGTSFADETIKSKIDFSDFEENTNLSIASDNLTFGDMDHINYKRLSLILAEKNKIHSIASTNVMNECADHFSAKTRVLAQTNLNTNKLPLRPSAFKTAIKSTCKSGGSSNTETSFIDALQFIERYHDSCNRNKRETQDLSGRRQKGEKARKPQSFGWLKFFDETKKLGSIVANDEKEILFHKNNLVESKINSKNLENCARFFSISMEYSCLHYEERGRMVIKATDIVLTNFIPKDIIRDFMHNY